MNYVQEIIDELAIEMLAIDEYMVGDLAMNLIEEYALLVLLDGKGYAHWGARGMPATDAVLGTIGGIALLSYFLTRTKPTAEQKFQPAAQNP